MRSLGQLASSPALLVSAGVCLIVALCVGIAAAIVLSLIPTYTSKSDFTPSGEKYCIDKLQLITTINATGATSFSPFTVNTSYPLSQACYRILQNRKSDSLLRSCLISDCIIATFTTPPVVPTLNMSCTAVIYYSTRCSDQSPVSGLNNSVTSSGNSACRTKRMTNINSALGSTSTTTYTNVPSLIISNTLVLVYNITTSPYSNYTQVGAKYCGLVSQSSITAAISTQATG